MGRSVLKGLVEGVQVPKQIWTTRTWLGILIYGLLFATVAYASWNTLVQKQHEAVASLKGGTLVYVSNDAWQAQLAQQASLSYGVHALEAHSLGSRANLPEALRGRTLVAPTLVLSSSAGPRIASGAMAVEKQIEQADATTSPFADGRKAIVLILLLALATPLLFAESKKLLAIYPLLGLFGLSLLYAPCVSCAGAEEGWMAATLIVLGLSYFSFAFAVLGGPLVRNRAALLTVATGGGIAPLMQVLALAASPRLCAGCLSVTAGAMLTGWAGLSLWRGDVLLRLRMPRSAMLIGGALFAALFSRAAANMMGYGQPLVETDHAVASLLGQPATKLLRGSVPRGRLVFVGSIACSACRQAESDLRSHAVIYSKVPPCSFIRDTDCFDYRGIDAPIPMFLRVDNKGLIVYQHNGWGGSPQEVFSLISQLRDQSGSPGPNP
ncbi:hypothetical protein BH11ARM2_BH11ARM2_21640 [soil metagenome]